MRCHWLLVSLSLITGCATHRPAMHDAAVTTPKPVVREAAPTKLVETRYEIRSYRDAENPGVRHEAHAIYRTTRVPARVDNLDTVPRTDFPTVTYTPLTPSTELSAELVAQKEITTELRAVQARMASLEQQAREQYGTLVHETADTVKLRQQLEAERAHLQEIEAKLRDRAASAAPLPAGNSVAADTKW